MFTCTKNSEIFDNDEFEDIIDQIHEHTDKRTTNSKKSEPSENFTKNNNSKNPEKMAQNSKEIQHVMKTQRSLSFESSGGQDPAWFTLSEGRRKNSIPKK